MGSSTSSLRFRPGSASSISLLHIMVATPLKGPSAMRGEVVSLTARRQALVHLGGVA
jgi:hypothetical protein